MTSQIRVCSSFSRACFILALLSQLFTCFMIIWVIHMKFNILTLENCVLSGPFVSLWFFWTHRVESIKDLNHAIVLMKKGLQTLLQNRTIQKTKIQCQHTPYGMYPIVLIETGTLFLLLTQTIMFFFYLVFNNRLAKFMLYYLNILIISLPWVTTTYPYSTLFLLFIHNYMLIVNSLCRINPSFENWLYFNLSHECVAKLAGNTPGHLLRECRRAFFIALGLSGGMATGRLIDDVVRQVYADYYLKEVIIESKKHGMTIDEYLDTIRKTREINAGRSNLTVDPLNLMKDVSRLKDKVFPPK